MRYVIIRDMSAGNDSVGEEWQETKIFDGENTLNEVMKWAMGPYDKDQSQGSRKKITITRPYQ